MSNPQADRPESLDGTVKSNNQLGNQVKERTGKAYTSGKMPPEQVIGKRKPMGRLKKRLIFTVVGALGLGMLILNFLPSGKSAKQNGSSVDAVYANDAMPQDIQEMALKLPQAAPTVASQVNATAYPEALKPASPFAGYPGTAGENGSSTRGVNAAPGSAAGRDYQGMSAAEAKMEAEAAARRAPMEVATKLTAGLTAGTSGQSETTTQNSPSGLSTNPTSATAATSGVPGAQYLPTGAQVQASFTPGEIYRDFNDQQSKAAFSQQQAESAAPNVGRPADPSLLPYTIFAGTIIPAALETAINTDLPGDVLATVAENVYDSVSGKNLLIPQGSKLLAQYSSNVSFGQSRVQVAWQRLIRPDGLSLQLSNMNGVDPQGMSGYRGSVDQHWWEYAKGIGLMALFSIIDGQLQYSIKTANTQGLSDIANSVTAGIDQVGTQYTSNAMNIQPTIVVKQGAKVQVFVNSDIIMPPANQRQVFQKYSIPKKEGENR